MKSRQFEILLYLMETKKTTYKNLAQHFEVSKKTIMRDIDKLSCMGIPIYTQSGYNGGIFIAPDYHFSKSFFTISEIEEMVLAFHIIDHLKQRNEKSTVLKKLESLVPELTFLKEFDLDQYLKIELLQNPITTCTHIYSTINQGLDEEVFLDITVNGKSQIIAPLHYILRPEGLFLYCTDSYDFFTIETAKISSCKITDKEFQRTDFQKSL